MGVGAGATGVAEGRKEAGVAAGPGVAAEGAMVGVCVGDADGGDGEERGAGGAGGDGVAVGRSQSHAPSATRATRTVPPRLAF